MKADGSFTPYEQRRNEFQEIAADFQDMAQEARQVVDAMERFSQAIEMIWQFAVVVKGRC